MSNHAATINSRTTVGRLLSAVDYGVAGMLVLAIAVIWTSLRIDLTFNTFYVDESDYMFAGRLLLDGLHWPTKTYIFSSNIPLYLIGTGSSIDPALGARALSLVPGLLSLVSLFLFYKSLLGQQMLAAISTGLVALQATHIFQGKIATYDIWCFFFFATAAWQFHTHTLSKRAVSLPMIGGSLLFAVAVLCKYVVVIYAPAIFFLLWLGCSRGAAFVFATLQAMILGIYALQNLPDLMTLFNTQLAGQHLQNSSALQVATLMVYLSWPVLLLAIPGGYKALQRRKSFVDIPPINRHLFKVLLVMALILPAYHLLSGNRIAVYKHVLYTVVFLAPLAALSISLIARFCLPVIKVSTIPVIAALLLLQAHHHTQLMETAYPNTAAAIAKLENAADHKSRILSENPYLHRNHFYKKIAIQHLHDMDALPSPTTESDAAALIREFTRGKYDYVLLDGRFQPQKTHYLRANMPQNYRLLYSEPYQTSDVTSGNSTGMITLYGLAQ